MIRIDRVIREDPEGVFGSGFARSFAVLDPVDGGKGDERVGKSEVNPKETARRAETEDASGDREIAIVVSDDFVGDGKEVESSLVERLVAGLRIAPEGLWGSEVLGQKWPEAGIEDKLVFSTVSRWGAVLP